MLNSFKKPDSPVALLVKNSPDLMSMIKEGDLVNGKLLKRAPRKVYFDLGRFGTGVIYGLEFSNAREVLKKLKEGDEVSAKVVPVENEDGYIELSLAEAGRQKVWHKLKELEENIFTSVKNKVQSRKKGDFNLDELQSLISGKVAQFLASLKKDTKP